MSPGYYHLNVPGILGAGTLCSGLFLLNSWLIGVWPGSQFEYFSENPFWPNNCPNEDWTDE
jgi:hypothetical protein